MDDDKKSTLKTYLGDSVYADIENGMVKLTTENGLGASNTIYMEREVTNNFERWLARLTEMKK
jgi:predicted ATPase